MAIFTTICISYVGNFLSLQTIKRGIIYIKQNRSYKNVTFCYSQAILARIEKTNKNNIRLDKLTTPLLQIFKINTGIFNKAKVFWVTWDKSGCTICQISENLSAEYSSSIFPVHCRASNLYSNLSFLLSFITASITCETNDCLPLPTRNFNLLLIKLISKSYELWE